ncbi:hypothetical protein CYMTET_48653 [Cymbomonas tetramitiformis]|uniref:Uncharacterized protein n=1 Tax=Cymbomonas tetramitiformis TaxID=36881 RepID=A0AAE0BRS3_9CHLO|nr:hypothetical protein CYMTET_48653 [Cymbomonas tetramitiformis]
MQAPQSEPQPQAAAPTPSTYTPPFYLTELAGKGLDHQHILAAVYATMHFEDGEQAIPTGTSCMLLYKRTAYDG